MRQPQQRLTQGVVADDLLPRGIGIQPIPYFEILRPARAIPANNRLGWRTGQSSQYSTSWRYGQELLLMMKGSINAMAFEIPGHPEVGRQTSCRRAWRESAHGRHDIQVEQTISVRLGSSQLKRETAVGRNLLGDKHGLEPLRQNEVRSVFPV